MTYFCRLQPGSPAVMAVQFPLLPLSELNVFPCLLLALYNFGFTVLCLQHTAYGQTLCWYGGEWHQCAEGVLHRDVLVQWKYRTSFDTQRSGTSIRMLILPDLYLHCRALLKINSTTEQRSVPAQEPQEQHTQDSFVSQYLTDTEGQVNCFSPITKLSNYTLLLSPALLISL